MHKHINFYLLFILREPSLTGDSSQSQFTNGLLRSARGSLPSVDSAVDSWGEVGDVTGVDIMRLWETASVDSGQLDLPMPPYPRYFKNILYLYKKNFFLQFYLLLNCQYINKK